MTVQRSSRPTTNEAELHVLSERAELAALRPAWDRLAAEDRRDGLFHGYAWNALWLDHVAPRATPHVVTVTGADGELVGLAPLCESLHRDRGFRLPSLGFTGRDVVTGDFLDILAAPGWEEKVLGLLVSHFEAALQRLPLLVLGELPMQGRTARHLAAWIGAQGRRARWQQERTCPFIELPDSFDAYRRSLSKNMKSNLRRRTRQLLEEQGCLLERLRGPEEVLPQMHHLYRLHAARWESVGQAGTFVRPGFRSFLDAFIAAAHPQAETTLYLLRHAGQPVAALLFFRWGDATLFYQGGWDPESPCTRFSPNLVIFGRAIHDAIADGLRTFEFLQGEESYKMKFTRTVRRTKTLLVAGRGLSPRAYLAALQAKDWAKRVLRRGK